MTEATSRWHHVERLDHDALPLAPDERAAFLREACGGNEALHQDVESLLAHASAASGFLNGAAVDAAARLMTDAQGTLIGRRIGAYRDLKPANIKITPDGVVKVLVFGLAKLAQASDSSLQSPDLSNAPTMSVGGTRPSVCFPSSRVNGKHLASGSVFTRRSAVTQEPSAERQDPPSFVRIS